MTGRQKARQKKKEDATAVLKAKQLLLKATSQQSDAIEQLAKEINAATPSLDPVGSDGFQEVMDDIVAKAVQVLAQEMGSIVAGMRACGAFADTKTIESHWKRAKTTLIARIHHCPFPDAMRVQILRIVNKEFGHAPQVIYNNILHSYS